MAGLTSTIHHPANINCPEPSKAFLFICTPFLSAPKPHDTHLFSTTISARYGGGGGAPRRSKTNENEAIDFSLLKSDNVRLIDQEQKMVGIVSKAQAFQMAEDAELDLAILSPEADPPVV